MLNYNSNKPSDLHELDMKHNNIKQAFYKLIYHNKKSQYTIPEEIEALYGVLKSDDAAIASLDFKQRIDYLKDSLEVTDNQVKRNAIIKEIRDTKLMYGKILGISPSAIDKYFVGCPYRVYAIKGKNREKETAECD